MAHPIIARPGKNGDTLTILFQHDVALDRRGIAIFPVLVDAVDPGGAGAQYLEYHARFRHDEGPGRRVRAIHVSVRVPDASRDGNLELAAGDAAWAASGPYPKGRNQVDLNQGVFLRSPGHRGRRETVELVLQLLPGFPVQEFVNGHGFALGHTHPRAIAERPTLHQSRLRKARERPGPRTNRAFRLHETSARISATPAQYLHRHENALCPRGITKAGEQDGSDPGPTNNNGAPLIEIEGLTKRFGTFTAVDNVSFTVSRGEVVGFLGPNGAGKSTTMRMLAGFMIPTPGGARILGHDVQTDGVAARRVLGFLPEGAPTYGEMSVTGFLRFCARIRGYRGQELH